MSGWIFTWKAVFILGVTVFACMAVWVTVGGFKDIKRLFARMEKGGRKGK